MPQFIIRKTEAFGQQFRHLRTCHETFGKLEHYRSPS